MGEKDVASYLACVVGGLQDATDAVVGAPLDQLEEGEDGELHPYAPSKTFSDACQCAWPSWLC